MGIISLLITIGGLFMASEFIGLISGFITGGGNALSEGSGLASSVKGRVKGGLGKVSSGMGKTVGAFSRAHGARTERRQNLIEAGSKDASKEELEALEKAQGARESAGKLSKLNYFSKANRNVRKAENAIKAHTKIDEDKDSDEVKAQKKAIQKEAGTGFLGAMGGSIGGGVLSTLGSVIKTTGFDVGAINEGRKKGIGEGRTKTQETHKERSEGQYGEKKAIRGANSIATDDATKTDFEAGKLMGAFLSKLTDSVGKEAFKIQLKDNSHTLDKTGLSKDASYETFQGQATAVSKLLQMIDRINGARTTAETNKQEHTNTAVKSITGNEAFKGDIAAGKDDAIKEYLTGKSTDLSGIYTGTNQEAFKAAMDLAKQNLEKQNKTDTATVKTLTAQTLDYAKTVDTTGNTDFTNIMDNLTGQLQAGLDAAIDGATVEIKPNTEIKSNVSASSLQALGASMAEVGKDIIKDMDKKGNARNEKLISALEKLNKSNS